MKGITRNMVRNISKARSGDNDWPLWTLCNDHSVSVKGTKFLEEISVSCLFLTCCAQRNLLAVFLILIVFVKLISLLKKFLRRVSVGNFFFWLYKMK